MSSRQLVTEAHARDILCTACEGGITYWANDFDKPVIDTFDYDGPDPFLLVDEYLRECTGEEVPVLRIGREHLEAAVLAILFPVGEHLCHSGLRKQIGSGFDKDSFDGDADCADAIVQVALFGKIVFG